MKILKIILLTIMIFIVAYSYSSGEILKAIFWQIMISSTIVIDLLDKR